MTDFTIYKNNSKGMDVISRTIHIVVGYIGRTGPGNT